VVGNGPASQLRALKFNIQSASARFPYRIRMVCGHVEIRMLNLKTSGRMYDNQLVINAGSGICAECDLAKANRRDYSDGCFTAYS
jgi:hypothetical protein